MLQQAQPLTKRAKRQLQKAGLLNATSSMPLRRIQPLTENQNRAFQSWSAGKDLFLHGTAGTGKTLLAFYFGLKEVLIGNANKVMIIRSVVPSREMGFLPGTAKEKSAEYVAPYYDICNTLFDRGDAYGILEQRGNVEFTTTSFLRGKTFSNCIMVIDECQNMSWGELNTIMTRVGPGTRIIFSGDTKQSDLDERKGKHDIRKFLRVCGIMDCFDFIQMMPDDVVRSGKAKEYILACEELGY